MDFDPRTTALVIARARAVIGLVMLGLPGVVGRVAFGSRGADTKALVRMVGARDLVLGVGAITSLKEQTQDAEWVSMGAFADGADAVALTMSRGPRVRSALSAATAVTAAAAGLLCARKIADARSAVLPPTTP